MTFGDARWSLGGLGWSPGAAKGYLVVIGHKINVLESLGKRCFWPSGAKRGVWGGSFPPFWGWN